jgi:nucleoside phosphorylase/adenine/guanine phosphoribosyltransferase-like PRPP-binding protein
MAKRLTDSTPISRSGSKPVPAAANAVRKVLIATALDVEYRQVKVALGMTLLADNSTDDWEVGKLCGKIAWQVVLICTGQQNDRAAVYCERAISYHRPDIVLYIGVAGGLKDVAIGDVVVAEKVYKFITGKAADHFLLRPESRHPSYKLIKHAARLSRRLNTHSVGTPTASSAGYYVFAGAVVSTDFVVSSTKSREYKNIKKYYNDSLAVDMEGYSFLSAAYSNPETLCVSIRGISDLIDNKTLADQGGSQQLAALNAGKFANTLLTDMDPNFFVKMIGWNEIGPAMDDLIAYADDFAPQYVVGVNRGGGIVGGVIAKSLGIDKLHLVYVDRIDGKLVVDRSCLPEFLPDSRILFADDTYSTGAILTAVRHAIARETTGCVIRSAVLVEWKHVEYYPGESSRVERPDRVGLTLVDRRLLPWMRPKV